MADIAAFDFDGTLTNGGSVFAFLEALTDRATVLSASAALAPRSMARTASGDIRSGASFATSHSCG